MKREALQIEVQSDNGTIWIDLEQFNPAVHTLVSFLPELKQTIGDFDDSPQFFGVTK